MLILFRDELVEEIKRVRRMYTLLWRANGALNSTFSLIILIALTIAFVGATIFLYFLANSFITSTPFLRELRNLMTIQLTLETLIFYFLLTTADTPVQQVTPLTSPKIQSFHEGLYRR